MRFNDRRTAQVALSCTSGALWVVAAALVIAETFGGHDGLEPTRTLALTLAATVTLAAVFSAIIECVRRYAYLDGVRDTVKAQRHRQQDDAREERGAVRLPRTGNRD